MNHDLGYPGKDYPPPGIPFKGAGSILSNFRPAKMKTLGRTLPNSEVVYQYRKAVEHEEWAKAQEIAQCTDPHAAMIIGRSIKTGDMWAANKFFHHGGYFKM